MNPCWTPRIVEATPYQHTDSKEVLGAYNTAMAEIASKISSEREPPTSQLESWDKSNVTQRQHYIQKATKDCMLVCEVIAPNDGKKLFQEMTCASLENLNIEAKVDYVTKSLINAYKNANNRNTKTQILSLYARKCSFSTLKKLHSQYGKLSTRQIRRERCHARIQGPGSILEQKKHHRVRIDICKVDYFVEFVNRPYFYQDVSYGSKLLKLDNGETIKKPNVVRTVTLSTMISQYMQFCQK